MKQKNKMILRNEIRIVDPSKTVWDFINKRSKNDKRSIGKQAEYIIEIYIKSMKKNKIIV